MKFLDSLEKMLFGKFDIDKAAEEVISLYNAKHYKEAAQHALAVLPQSKSIRKHETDALGIILFYGGRALADLGQNRLTDSSQNREALQLLLEAEAFYSINFPQNVDIRLVILKGMGDCYQNLKRFDEAFDIFAALEKRDEMKTWSGFSLKIYNALICSCLGKRDYQKAIDYYEKYLSEFQISYPDYEKSQRYFDVLVTKEKYKAALKAKSLNYSEAENGFISYKIGNGGGMMDITYAAYFVSDLPDPAQKDLDDLFDKTKSIRISQRTFDENPPKVILVIDDANTLKDVKDNFAIRDESPGHVMCIGTYLFDFITQNDEKHQIEYLGYGAIRWEKAWKDDAQLENPHQFLEWLANNGIDEPLKAWVEASKQPQSNFSEQLEFFKKSL